MRKSSRLARSATGPDPLGRRAGAVRVVANALLVLLAYEVVSLVLAVAQLIATGPPPSVTPVELLVLVAVFILVRWLFVLPGLLLVLIGIEFVARRTRHARLLTAVVAFGPMVLWELTQSSGRLSSQGAILGVIAVVFAVLARLPARSAEEQRAAAPPAATPVAPR